MAIPKYHCPYCKSPIWVGKRKQIILCDCGRMVDLAKLRQAKPKDTVSVLDRILNGNLLFAPIGVIVDRVINN